MISFPVSPAQRELTRLTALPPDTDLMDSPLCRRCIMDALDFYFGVEDRPFREGDLRIAFDPEEADMDFAWGEVVGEVYRSHPCRDGLSFWEERYRVRAVGRELGAGFDIGVFRLEAE